MINILIAGDFCPHKRIQKLVEDNNQAKIYNDFLPHLQHNNLNVLNLECPLTNNGYPINKVGPHLKAGTDCVEALTYGGFQLVTLANNHIMDQGADGLNETLKTLTRNNIAYVGAGKNLEDASKVFYFEEDGMKIAFLNFCESEFSIAEQDRPGALPLNPIQNYYQIKEAGLNADFVIVITHGGHEGYSLPSPRMVETYRFFIDAGADIVINHHSHCFSGFEAYRNGTIFYGLGNFIFDWEGENNSDWNNGYVVKLSYEKRKTSFQIIPYKQCGEEPGLLLLNEHEKQSFDNALQKLNKTIADRDLLEQEWHIFVKKNSNAFIMDFECSSSRLYQALRYRKIIPCLLSENKKKKLLNLIRCESHRDIVIESLKSRNTD